MCKVCLVECRQRGISVGRDRVRKGWREHGDDLRELEQTGRGPTVRLWDASYETRIGSMI